MSIFYITIEMCFLLIFVVEKLSIPHDLISKNIQNIVDISGETFMNEPVLVTWVFTLNE